MLDPGRLRHDYRETIIFLINGRADPCRCSAPAQPSRRPTPEEDNGKGIMIVRPIIVTLAVLLLAVQVLRINAAEIFRGRSNAATRLWSYFPDSALLSATSELAGAERTAGAPSSSFAALLRAAAARDPLAAGPYLVLGAQAELAGNVGRAQQAFEAAQRRDPRSFPAADFLADRYLRIGDPRRGLEQVWALSRLDPAGPQAAAHYVAAYAKDPSTFLLLRRQFSKYNRPGDVGLLAFEERSRSPFDWSLTSSATGVAEPEAGGLLHIIYYGREEGFLASRLLLLAPGAYRLSMELRGAPVRARMLSWSLWCDGAGEAIASSTLEAVAERGLTFTIPANCPSQWLRLGGISSQMPRKSDVTVALLKLAKAAPGA